MKKLLFSALVTATLLALRAVAPAQAVTASFNPYGTALGGSTADYQWQGFTSTNRPAGVSSSINGNAGQWLAGIAPANDPSSGARFAGDSNFGSDTTDFLSASNGGGIYAFFSQTHFTISDPTPFSDLQSLTLQIYLAEGLTGAMGGSPADLAVAPTLTLQTTAGPEIINPTYSLLFSSTPATVNGMSTALDLLTYQWDLSSVTSPVESYEIEWQTAFHSVTIGADATESSAVNQADVLAVPEPSTSVFALLGFVLLFWRFRFTRWIA